MQYNTNKFTDLGRSRPKLLCSARQNYFFFVSGIWLVWREQCLVHIAAVFYQKSLSDSKVKWWKYSEYRVHLNWYWFGSDYGKVPHTNLNYPFNLSILCCFSWPRLHYIHYLYQQKLLLYVSRNYTGFSSHFNTLASLMSL